VTATEGERVRIGQAKGRPMLSWVGKRPLREVRAFPAQLAERFAPQAPEGAASTAVDWSDWPERFDRGGLLFHGDNKEVLAHLLANGFRGKVDLVYIDPPFDSGADYVRKVQLRGASGSARLDGESYTLGEQIQYTDIWANDTYLQFMYERLLLLKEFLSRDGVIAVHLDWKRSSQLRLVLDELFGSERFINEVVWHYFGFKRSTAHNYSRKHDSILIFANGSEYKWTTQYIPHSAEYLRRWKRDEDGRLYRNDVNPTGGGTRIIYLDEVGGDIVDSVWDDIPPVNPLARERADFPTQKPEGLADRLIRTFTAPGDIVLDCFIGSGTTAAVAQKLGRRWIGADINKGAIQTTGKRLAGIIREQVAAAATEQLAVEDGDGSPKPAQLSFTTYRVNDYDLQIQHNEAVELAVEHLGVQRTRTDPFFHDMLGRELVYIVPFDHPATALDLQAVRRELDARPQEERNVVVVGLGRELSTEAWLDEYNRRRPVNRIRLIDLRTDPKHGRFFEHVPASARVSFNRSDGCIRVSIDDFISPSIIERLGAQEGVLSPQIEDWRAMVDPVAIDAAYDGGVFDVDLIDIPERRADLVAGRYELDAPDSPLPAAARITDMLGEEVLVVEERA
jgi:DNA modification methylase